MKLKEIPIGACSALCETFACWACPLHSNQPLYYNSMFDSFSYCYAETILYPEVFDKFKDTEIEINPKENNQ